VKFLADMGVSMTTVQALRGQGHETIHLREEKLSRLSDADILEKARQENRIIITFDLDFGDLLAAGGHSFRASLFSASTIRPLFPLRPSWLKLYRIVKRISCQGR